MSLHEFEPSSVTREIRDLPFPKEMEKQLVILGIRFRQNHMMLEMLSEQSSENSPSWTEHRAISLPLIFPKLYER